MDCYARRVTMTSMLYYGCGLNVISDAEFDDYCKQLVANWHLLTPLRKWCLGTPEELSASGYHCRITQAGVGGAVAWYEKVHGQIDGRIYRSKEYIFSKKHHVSWLKVTDFHLQQS